MVKSTSATIITCFRPTLSAKTPASGLAKRANRLVHEVIMLFCAVVSALPDKSSLIETRVAEITPVLELKMLVV